MTIDVGIYARYSTDMQREASIEDQARICERLIKDRDWQTYRVYCLTSAPMGPNRANC